MNVRKTVMQVAIVFPRLPRFRNQIMRAMASAVAGETQRN